ncbi:FKBP-type peptidyl-prolyl cis-trans isomerase [Archangium violaceum]|uniref:FKBP-type peptidyl-prolyl cis-trans isomerase n=1 Tax=Archangium violaceum TaxID=83451 RepID=UPI0019518274|nr:FKBP-type peptidyl-prolyl cis-trans isomerase [Archangium violaceum]QRN97321.1 FKBP-type peptidyl-prolyl cis-trans isomerase [Archangium violaceum]
MSNPSDGKAGTKGQSPGSSKAAPTQQARKQPIKPEPKPPQQAQKKKEPVEQRQAPPPASASGRQLVLPVVRAPSLDDLHVTVPAPEDITEQDVLERFHELMLEYARKRERAPGEPVRMGDLVLLETLGYAEGRLIPFSARSELELELDAQAFLPGFSEALVGTPVGENREVELTLPEDYPVEDLRGVKATFLVDVLGAQEVTLPDPESQEFIQELERGQTVDKVMESIADDLEEELAEELWLEARELVMDELVRRTGEVSLPPELVDEEIRRRWEEGELPLLRAKDFDADELKESLDGWLGDASTRREAERSLRIALALRAIVERDKLQLTPEKLEALVDDAVEPFGLSPEEARQALADPQTAGPIRDAAMHLLAVDHVMEHARVEFESGPEPSPGRPAADEAGAPAPG